MLTRSQSQEHRIRNTKKRLLFHGSPEKTGAFFTRQPQGTGGRRSEQGRRCLPCSIMGGKFMKKFNCKYSHKCSETEEWTGTAELIRKTASTTEAVVKGRGSTFAVIVGDYTSGHFLCIPDINVGCPMVGWGGSFGESETAWTSYERDGCGYGYHRSHGIDGRAGQGKEA